MEDGTITGLYKGITSKSIILIVTGVHTIRYFHMFDETHYPICSGDFVLDENSDGQLAIVKLVAGTKTRAEYILSV